MPDGDDVNDDPVVVDGIYHSEIAPARGVQTVERRPERIAETVGVACERPEDELQAGGCY